MEEAEVKQLISLIESAQLQYEVDESGTVSIVCDPVQLVDSAGIDDTGTSVDINTNDLLTQHIEATVTTEEENEKHGEDSIILESGRREDGGRLEEILEKKGDDLKTETSQQNENEDLIETSGSTPPIHYFLQTPNGEIIQVLESLEGVNEGSTEGEVQALEGISSDGNFTSNTEANADENMQIFVVGSCDGGDMFLINASDRQMTEENGNSIDVSQVMLKGSAVEDGVDDQMNKETEGVLPLPLDHGSKSTENHGDVFTDTDILNGNQNFDKTPEISTKIHSPQVRSDHRKKKLVYSKDVTMDTSANNKQYVKRNSQTKLRSPLRGRGPVISPSEALVEGSVVQTYKGEMMAFNLSSVAKEEPSGKKTALQNLASSFGSWVKVLRPVDPEKKVDAADIEKRFSVFSCADCGTMLHSERSLKIHRRRYHEAWDDECFICGEKFLNLHYVRTHIREVHNEEKSFECRYCPFRCSLLKEFFKHCRVHKKSQVCINCGKKYVSPKLFQDHVANCVSKGGPELNYVNGVECEYQTKVTKGPDKERCLPYQNSLIMTPSRKKSGKFDQNNKRRDVEFKIESKHYSQQIKKMALEQPLRKPSKGRYRTHRCYLCFKFFSNSADLDMHKEVYHQAKSSQPVRVKTDESLWGEEEDMIGVSNANNNESSFGETMSEEVQIKSEPPDLSEKVDNVTIVLDESMNLYQIIKPLCIACRAYTKTDFSQSCKLFQNISKCDQLEALRNFEKFFPCAIDTESLLGPWVLCRKCSLLIDKIADMEQKLTAMKSNLILRLQGNTETNSENATEKCLDESALKKECNDSKCSRALTTDKVSENIKKSLGDIEAYMKNNCEIMAVIHPQRKGRSRKNEIEKLAPILVSDDEFEEFTISHPAKVVLRKEENIVLEGNMNTEKNNIEKTMKVNIVKKEVPEDIVDKSLEIQTMNIKSEPPQRDLESILPNTVTSSWEDMGGNPLNSVDHIQEDDFLIPTSKTRKDSQLNSDLFPSQLLSVEVDCESSQTRNVKESQVESFEKCDFVSEEVCTVRTTGSPEPAYFPSNSQKGLDKIEIKADDEDSTMHFQEVLKNLESKTETENLTNKESEENSTATCLRTSPDELSAAEEEMKSQAKCHDSSRTAAGMKKRAKVREERNMMSYRMEGNVAKPWLCSGCHKGFSTQRGACDHYAASHLGQNYSCEHCSASYVRKRDLIGHYNRVHLKAKPYKCKKCNESFSMHSQLYRHMQSAHMEVKREPAYYSCHLCNASFTQKRYKDAHVIVCETKGSDSTPHACPQCDKSFKLPKYLRVHMRTAHSYNSDTFLCGICNKVLKDQRNLILHMKSHTGETKTSCNVCNKEFSRKSYLWTHMRVHTKERPYGCNYCPRWFRQYSTWKNHERTHTGEKPYRCNICNSCFATSSSVSKHLQYAHYNIRDFGCLICKKSFISKGKLEEHMKTHTGEKPYECSVCNRAFNKKTNLRTHMYIHSTNKRFKCELCGEGFMRRTTIENHILDRHSDLEFMLGSNISNGEKGTAGGMAAATSPFISVVGAEDMNTEETYIVLYANEKEAETSKDMQVTVLAEDSQSSQVEATSKHLPLSVVQNQIPTLLSTNVLPEVIVKDEDTVGGSEVTYFTH